MFPAYLLLLAAAPAQEAPAAAAGSENTIVVTGKTLAETDAALKACLARACPPDEDVAATLAHAENQFVSGDYEKAQATLSASVRRNKRHARDYPVPVSDLMRGNARVAEHLGESETFRLSTLDMLSALRAGLSRDDARVLVAEVEVADSFAKMDQPLTAERNYYRIARRAKALGQDVVEGYALLRVALLNTQLAYDKPTIHGPKARRTLDAIIDSQVPGHRRFVPVARVLKARLAAVSGDKSAVDQLIAEFRAAPPSTRPALLYAEPIKLAESSGRSENGGSVTSRMAMESFDNQWVDVGFWVAPDGRTTDVEVLRQSEKAGESWVKPVLASIKSRRYAPLKLEPTDPGILRVERYTYTSRWTTNVGSRLRVREAEPRIEMLDLSQDDPTDPAQPGAQSGG